MDYYSNNRSVLRRNFSKVKSVQPIPDLMEIQKKSYDQFLQYDLSKKGSQKPKENIGLENIFRSVFPIQSANNKYILEYVDYYLEEPRTSLAECRNIGATYSALLKVRLRLTTNDVNPQTGVVTPLDVKEQDMFFAEVPLMVNNGVFVVNGTDRVVVSQIHRAPGVFFGASKGQYNSIGKPIYNSNIIPKRGSWLDIEFDGKDVLYIKIDKRKKFLASVLLKALYSQQAEEAMAKGEEPEGGILNRMTVEEILNTFYEQQACTKIGDDSWKVEFNLALFRGKKLVTDLINAKNGEVVLSSGTTVNRGAIRKIEQAKLTHILLNDSDLVDRNLAKEVIGANGKVIHKIGETITEELLQNLDKNGIKDIQILAIDGVNVGPYILNTLLLDKGITSDRALKEIYKSIKVSEVPSVEIAADFFDKLFFDPERYDLSEVGRVKINERLNLDEPLELGVLTKKDIIAVFKQLIAIREGCDTVDDIDHLSNRRIRSVGELLETEIRIAMLKIQRNVADRMGSVSTNDTMAGDVLNVRPLQTALKEFFGVSQLSQFMDQTNPLAEITHKRRLSALGPKGLSRERAGFEVRDVHPTHYGRICPIETPEGPNIGLISSLAIYARVNKYGFLETLYRKVVDGKVTDEVVYLPASQERGKTIAHSNVKIGPKGELLEEFISSRRDDDFVMALPTEVDYVDVSPQQLVSAAASLVPFLENDDANRALMGANMQRQAVPLLIPEAPLVGTGMEATLAKYSEAAVISKREGIVDFVDGSKIVIKTTEEDSDQAFDTYILNKFQKSNHSTCINQKPLVLAGDKVKVGDVLADGQSCDKGELALGKNILVAFMPWNGYNFEDSILVSERVVTNEVFTSIHIEEFDVVARDTKLGAEEITDDIPNVGEEALRNLDQSGIVYVGAEVKTGDVLVGKVTPKAESIVTPEERLLKAIFGEKALDVKDTSLRVPSGVSGTVIGVRVFTRRGMQKDSRSILLEKKLIAEYAAEREEQYALLNKNYSKEVHSLLKDQKFSNAKALKLPATFKEMLAAKTPLQTLLELEVEDKKIAKKLSVIKDSFVKEVESLQANFLTKVEKLQQGDDLPANVLKMVKVYIAVKRKLQPGDKMAGRHGNKGVVSKILPIADMPYLEDGTPIDICLSPLGVPSRMNIGQILEAHLGWAASNIGKQIYQLYLECQKDHSKIGELRKLILKAYGHNEEKMIKGLTDEELLQFAKTLKKGVPMAAPVFDGAKESDINELLDLAGMDSSGQVTLIDGRTGEPFERKITVGYMYILKLHHLVDDKIHARSVGPYSLITQQPLGGKAQFGGQRFGEMEVWALEAYGASYILKEMLTVKSDDQVGRIKVYESIVKGEETFKTGIPESFNVLVKELRSLGLDLDLHNSKEHSNN